MLLAVRIHTVMEALRFSRAFQTSPLHPHLHMCMLKHINHFLEIRHTRFISYLSACIPIVFQKS